MSDHSVHTQLAEYFRIYGGARAVLRSPFMWAATVGTALCAPLWLKQDWWADVISIIPGLLGVSLAAFTLFLSAGSENFRNIIAGRSEDDADCDLPSPYLKTASIFLHFLTIQLVALLFSLLAKSAYKLSAPPWFTSINEFIRPVFWGLGYFLFLYALMVVLAASLGVFEVVRWYDDYATDLHSNQSEENKDQQADAQR